eukprot:gnl/Chilomastix_cuspidata/1945.p1 GENE.gnl/Chilomastix_cuspidata/1945~~gnl/Chilomastix_cuspidata/1945.p1  ORF type:complete len:1037 (-),score=550.99 gnl/Chilomastix_cuspidata/1945:225-3335(-)
MADALIGKEELFEWAGRLCGVDFSEWAHCVDGSVVLKIMSTIWPDEVDLRNPRVKMQPETSDDIESNWTHILELFSSIGIPNIIDIGSVVSGSPKDTYNLLVMLFFLKNLSESRSFAIDFKIPVDPRLAEFLQSTASLSVVQARWDESNLSVWEDESVVPSPHPEGPRQLPDDFEEEEAAAEAPPSEEDPLADAQVQTRITWQDIERIEAKAAMNIEKAENLPGSSSEEVAQLRQFVAEAQHRARISKTVAGGVVQSAAALIASHTAARDLADRRIQVLEQRAENERRVASTGARAEAAARVQLEMSDLASKLLNVTLAPTDDGSMMLEELKQLRRLRAINEAQLAMHKKATETAEEGASALREAARLAREETALYRNAWSNWEALLGKARRSLTPDGADADVSSLEPAVRDFVEYAESIARDGSASPEEAGVLLQTCLGELRRVSGELELARSTGRAPDDASEPGAASSVGSSAEHGEVATAGPHAQLAVLRTEAKALRMEVESLRRSNQFLRERAALFDKQNAEMGYGSYSVDALELAKAAGSAGDALKRAEEAMLPVSIPYWLKDFDSIADPTEGEASLQPAEDSSVRAAIEGARAYAREMAAPAFASLCEQLGIEKFDGPAGLGESPLVFSDWHSAAKALPDAARDVSDARGGAILRALAILDEFVARAPAEAPRRPRLQFVDTLGLNQADVSPREAMSVLRAVVWRMVCREEVLLRRLHHARGVIGSLCNVTTSYSRRLADAKTLLDQKLQEAITESQRFILDARQTAARERSDLQLRVDLAEAAVKELQSQLQDTQEDLDDLRGGVNEAERKSIGTLRGRIRNLREEINNLKVRESVWRNLVETQREFVQVTEALAQDVDSPEVPQLLSRREHLDRTAAGLIERINALYQSSGPAASLGDSEALRSASRAPSEPDSVDPEILSAKLRATLGALDKEKALSKRRAEDAEVAALQLKRVELEREELRREAAHLRTQLQKEVQTRFAERKQSRLDVENAQNAVTRLMTKIPLLEGEALAAVLLPPHDATAAGK